MEGQKHSIRLLSIARKHSSLPSTHRNLIPNHDENVNIFQTEDKEHMGCLNVAIEKSYNFVGVKQIKEYIKKSKKSAMPRKIQINSSLKSYTLKSTDLEDILLTKEELIAYMERQKKSMEASLVEEIKQNQSILRDQRKIINSRWKQSRNKSNSITNRNRNANNILTNTIERYQQKIQKLNKYALKQKKQNIQANKWNSTLRNTIQLGDIYFRQQQNMANIKRDGYLKLKAASKHKKQSEWIYGQRDNALFQFISAQKQARLLQEKKKNQQI